MDNLDFSKTEEEQYNRVKDKILNEFSDVDDEYYMLVDYIVGNKQYDIIFFKNKSIIIIELKSYKGKIWGSENSDWYVNTPNNGEVKIEQNKNPFKQVREQRYEFMDFLNEKLTEVEDRFKDKHFSNISAIICFESGSSYDDTQVDKKKNLWFDVVSEDEIIDYIINEDSREYHLRNCEIKEFFSNLNVKKKNQEKEEREDKIKSDKGTLSNEDILNITEKIEKEFSKDDFTIQDISDSIDPETGSRYIDEALDRGILKKLHKNRFHLTEDYEENLPKKESETDVNIGRFTEDDFYLKPESSEKGEIYEGVYRGTKYSINYKRDVWWRRDWEHPKHMVEFSDEDILEEILDLRSQGGSFRITEAGEVLTKVYDQEDGYVPIYVGEFDGKIEFEDFEWNPNDIEKGDLWPAPYDGATFSVNANKELKVNIGNIKTKAVEGHEDLVNKVLKFKDQGGRFKINENGKILTLLYQAPYPEQIQKQMDELTNEEKNLIDIRDDADIDGMIPIYIGDFSGNIKFKKIFNIHEEWTEDDDKEFLERIGAI